MVGANYMGGKRNAMKSKLRDATSRTQQGFFGRRRFELLSRGLAPTDSNTDAIESNKRPEITLAHARNKYPQRLVKTHARIPSPVRAQRPQPTRDLEIPCSNKRPEAYRHVDMTSEISPRSLRESALSLSDLAGLKRGDTAPRLSCKPRAAKSPQETNPTHSSPARQSTPSLSFSMSPDTGSAQSRSRWRSPSSRVDQPVFRESPSDNIDLRSFASSLSPLLSDFSSLDRIEERIQDRRGPHFCYVPSNISRRRNNTILSSCSVIAFPEETPNISTQNGVVDLEDFSDSLGQLEPDGNVDRSEESLLAYSDLDSPFRFTSPSNYHVVGTFSPNPELRGGNHRSLSLETDSACSRSPTSDTSPFTWVQTSRGSATPSPHYDYDQSPCLGNGSPAWLRGCIFDYEDPWDAIGIIMGLSPNSPNKVTLEEELATLCADGFRCATAVSDDTRCNNALDDYSDERTSCTMFSPVQSWIDTTHRRSSSSCISHCNNTQNAHSRDTCGSSELTDLADVSAGCFIDGDFMAHELPDCFDEADLDSALTCYGTISRSCTKSSVVALSTHWPLSPTHTIPTNDNHFQLPSYDRQSECSPNKDFVAEEKPEADGATIIPSPERPPPIDTTSFTRHHLPLVADDGRQVESYSDNNVGIERSLTLAYSSSAQPAEDLNSHTTKERFCGLLLFRDDSDAEST